jgi:hypothetical protein
VLQEKQSKRPQSGTAAALFLESALTDRLFDPYEPGRFAFVTCFCERGNLLSQWRAYADKGAGYSIGFSWGGLFNNHRSAHDQPLCKVLYDEKKQLAPIRKLVNDICKTLADIARGVSADVKHGLIDEALRALRIVLMDYLPCFKHPGFEEEREWRIVQNCDVDEEYTVLQNYLGYEGKNLGRLKFRPAAGMVAPYVNLEIKWGHQPFWSRLPIKSVMHGPTQYPMLAKESLRMLFESQGYRDECAVQILGSDVPLRV